ncbi:MAG: ATP-binding cassette domain-containing protein [Nitrososphaerota archaeon]|nr:ATP-binding cassette domain-containing protein [Nitrososphaerota archaeon]
MFKVDRSYNTKTRVTKRTIAVGEAFGLGIEDQRRFSIFTNFQIEIKPGQVVLITGDSGSGKSTLLNEISSQLSSGKCEDFKGRLVSNSSIRIPEDELIIEGVGRDISEAISVLSMSGLNEAFLMLRKFRELSDGQKYRYRVARMIDSGAETWIFDEFAALLDRVTAKCVSYTIQKTARKLRRTLVVATTHEDLLQDLKPDIWIQKKFGDQVSVTEFSSDSFDRRCTLLKDIKIEPCSMGEIRHLEQFHYRGGLSNLVKFSFKAELNGEVVGALVAVPPHLQLKGRNLALPQFRGRSSVEMAKKINREIVRIARVIVAPKFRSIGLGAEMVRKTMPLMNTKYVEALAVMAKYNSFFESAGMQRVNVEGDEREERDVKELETLGFRAELLPSRKHVESVAEKLDRRGLEVCKKFALRYCAVAKRRRESLIPRIKRLDRAAIVDALTLRTSRPVYLYWRNPLL